jgi:hypothetical protein
MSKKDCLKEAERIIEGGVTDAKYLQAAPYFFAAGELKEFQKAMSKAGKIMGIIAKDIANEDTRKAFLGAVGPLSEYVVRIKEEREEGKYATPDTQKRKCREAIDELAEKAGLEKDAKLNFTAFILSQAEICLDAIVLYQE